ncbi:DNA polymerase zeta [Paecilomyces lecythidis]|uniref:DNA polymerase n=1 Tax=Paecilomyces lecythidis TaxID=3004212 RepID=A0ABR3X2X4_9EURO
MDLFKVRLNCIDHYQAVPSEFDPPVPYDYESPERRGRPKVPVIRVFGATETGQKVCAHVHGAFPYLYVEYEGSLERDEVNSALRTFHVSIDHALAVSYRRNAYDGKTAYVAHVSLVKGTPFYGYHVGYKFYFKTYLLNPLHITRLADLLRQGAVMKRQLQPYESHLQYIPQWMCDYNLYGCADMGCRKVKFRAPVPEYLDLSDLSHQWHNRSIPGDLISDDSVLPKQSHCPLEVDICVQDIMNRFEVQERLLHHDFIERLQPLPSDLKLVPSMAGLWQDETRRRKKKMGLIDPDSTPFGPEELVSMSADPRHQEKGGWIHEDDYRQKVLEIVSEEKRDDGDCALSFDNFVSRKPFESEIQTILQSVEELFPQQLQQSTLQRTGSQHAGEISAADIQVDEDTVLSFRDGDNFFYSDDEYSDQPYFAAEESDQPSPDPLNCNPDAGGETAEQLYEIGFEPNVRTLHDSVYNDYPVDPFPLPSTDLQKAEESRNAVLESDESCDVAYRPQQASASLKRVPEDHGPTRKRRRRLDYSVENQDAAVFASCDTPGRSTKPANGAVREATVDGKGRTPRGTPSSPPKSSSSQKTLRPPGDGSNQRIQFPVVKDPNDPATVLRFSQQSASSKLTLESSQKIAELSQKQEKTDNSSKQDHQSPSQSHSFSSLSTSMWIDPHIAAMGSMIHHAFNIPTNRRVFCYCAPGPTPNDVCSTMNDDGHPSVVYQKAYYSDETDVPERQREYAGRGFRLESDTLQYLPEFDPTGRSPAMFGERAPVVVDRMLQEQHDQRLREESSFRVWEFAPVPPTRSEVVSWFEENVVEPMEENAKMDHFPSKTKPNVLSQIEGATQQNAHGFKYSQKQESTSVEHQAQYMSVMSLEVHVNTRGSLIPNPEEDEITCVFWCLKSDDQDLDVNTHLENVHVGILAQGEDEEVAQKLSKVLTVEVTQENTELDLITRLVDIVRFHDPDIVTGYEVHNSSWGYLIQRARYKYDYDLCDELSRVKSQSHGRFGKENDLWGFNTSSSIRITGRHMINIGRAMRSELNLLQYTMENVTFHLLHRRVPHYPFKTLTSWYTSGKPRDLMKVIDYFVSRVQINIEILDANELIPRISEQARLLGIDFFSVITRGSQFKVESLMFRIAKPENFMLVSPSKKQVGQQNALECIPLVMEPQSDFYTSPLLVLDFQSLYPSVVIAYNYCYSTFLGRAVNWRGRNKMGFTDYKRQPRILELLEDCINIAPNGMIYAKPEIRKSLLAKMLTEILETRVMVKGGMKVDKDDKTLQRLLNNRQLALKLIANVTYGYTSASFSGRMPCSEIADSIVQTGRETLEKAIALIHSVERWGAEVVYGDTDSLFVYLKGRSREQAFDIGEEIAKTVTEMNPRPVKLKFEKVYHPCVLLAKKRYVGFKYERRDQTEPEFDAKGIETVRRDGTPAEQKIEEKALKLLFKTADLSKVKSYFQDQCAKIMQGRVSIQDFCFAREVRLGTYSEKGLPPPGALISAKRMLEDPRLEPQYGERVPYVVITGAPGSRLIDRCVAPEVLLHDAQLELDAEYYITKNIIPPLERIFNLVGANVRQWYDEMPKFQRIRRVEGAITKDTKKTLESYMKSSACVICREKLNDTDFPLCSACLSQPHISLLRLKSRLQRAEKRTIDLHRICRSCMGVPFGDDVACDSKDCPVFYSRVRHMANWDNTTAVLEPVVKLLEERGGELDW